MIGWLSPTRVGAAVRRKVTDIGQASRLLVRLGVRDAAGVREAFSAMQAAATDARVHLTGVIVAQQIKGQRELMIGARVDPVFGPVVLVGDELHVRGGRAGVNTQRVEGGLVAHVHAQQLARRAGGGGQHDLHGVLAAHLRAADPSYDPLRPRAVTADELADVLDAAGVTPEPARSASVTAPSSTSCCR